MSDDFSSIIWFYWPKEDLPASRKILSLIYCDLDKFKYINDTFWHLAWDAVLSEFIDFIKKELRRKDDNLYRIWWDEFVLLCNFTDKENIKWRINKMKNDFARRTVIIDIEWENIKVSSIMHWDILWAKAYFNANNLYTTTILSELKEKDDVKKIKWKKRIVLPPIWSSWWIVDYKYNSKTKENDLNSILANLKDKADFEMYKVKKAWKIK